MRATLRNLLLGTAAVALVLAAALLLPGHLGRSPVAPDLQLAAYSALPGFTSKLATSVNDSSPQRIVTANCPKGTVVVGGYGGTVNGEQSAPSDIADTASDPQAEHVKITDIGPVLNPSTGRYGFVAAAMEIGSYPGRWYVQAVAYCAATPLGYTFQNRVSAQYGGENQRAVAQCRIPGTVPLVVGGGVVAHALADLSPVTLRGFQLFTAAGAEPQVIALATSTAGQRAWVLHVNAACAYPLPGRAVVPAHSGPTFITSASVATAQCSPGSRGYSAFGFISPGVHAHLTWQGFFVGRADLPTVYAATDYGAKDVATFSATGLCAR